MKRFLNRALCLWVMFSIGLLWAQNETPPLLKKDFMVNSLTGSYNSDQIDPSVAVDSSGFFAITWVDERNGVRQPFVQIFNPQGEKVGQNILLDSTAMDYNGYPVVAASDVGRFVITWGNSKRKIYFQLMDIQGRKVGEKVDLTPETSTGQLPSVAMDPKGRFLVVWKGANVLAKLFDKDGNELVPTFQVNSESGVVGTGFPGVCTVASDARGHFAIAFTQPYQDYQRIFLQMVDSSGSKIGNPILVSDPNRDENDNSPWITSTRDGAFLIVWYEGFARIYRFGKGFVTDQFRIPDRLNWPQVCGSELLTATSNGRDQFFTAFGYDSLRIITIDTSGVFLNKGIPVPDYQKIKFNIYVFALSHTNSGRMIGVVQAYQKTDMDLDYIFMSQDLRSFGSFVKFDDDSSHGPQLQPKVVANQKGQTLVVWADRRLGEYDLFGQVYDAEGNPIGNNICITPEEDVPYFGILPFQVAAFEDGMFVLTYVRVRKDKYNTNVFKVFLRRVNSDGTLNGPEKEIAMFYNSPPAMKLFTGGKNGMAFLWYNSDKIYSAYYYSFNETMNFTPKTIKILPMDSIKAIHSLKICADRNLNFLLLWQPAYAQANGYKWYGRFFDQNNQPIGQTFVLGDGDTPFVGGQLLCSMESPENYTILYYHYNLLVQRFYRVKNEFHKFQNDLNILLDPLHYHLEDKLKIQEFKNRKLLFTLTRDDNSVLTYYIDDNKNIIREYNLFQLKHPTNIWYFDGDLMHYDLDVSNGKILLAYESNRHGNTDFDIWARVYDLDGLNFKPEPFYDLRNQFKELLFQNAPNPFRNTTKIPYYLPTVERITLIVYDALGRKVATLQDGMQSAGWHECRFDASRLASGIYFCRLQGFHDKVIKLLHLR